MLKGRVVSLAAIVMSSFLGIVMGMNFAVAFMGTGGNIHGFLSGDTSSFPNWFWIEPFFGPQDGCGSAARLAFGRTEVLGFEIVLPPWLNVFSTTKAEIICTQVPSALVFIQFQKRGI